MPAQANTANGGIGVTYSNVVLQGGLNPNDNNVAKSSYQHATRAGSGQGPIGPDGDALAINRNRFVPPSDPNPRSNTRVGGVANPYAYVKGVDFNSQQKYDYNILSGQPLS